MFSESFIPIRVVVDTKIVEYTLYGVPLHYRAPCTHKFTHSFMPRCNLEEPIHLLAYLEKTDMDMRRTYKTPHKQQVELRVNLETLEV